MERSAAGDYFRVVGYSDKMINEGGIFGQNSTFPSLVPLRKVLTRSCYANDFTRVEAFLTVTVTQTAWLSIETGHQWMSMGV